MIAIKLFQGAKLVHEVILPTLKVTEEIVKIRILEIKKDPTSPPMHSEFSTSIGLLF